ncbi:MAG: EamA family transporter [Proteobacteria bacterium]|nr:EamA family transporter [Pseudomonadota bacterium]
MIWFYLSLVTAIALATSDALSKSALKNSDDAIVAWARWGLASPFLLFLLFFIDIPPLDLTFWLVLVTALPLEITAILLYMRAIRLSPLSLTVPFLALTPVFLIVTSFILLGELPDRSGVMGIILVTGGAYLLNIRSNEKGLLAPLKAIAKEKGSLLMIVVAFIYSITSNLGKIAVLHSSPLFFAIVYANILTLVMLPLVMRKRDKFFRDLKVEPLLFIMIGLSYGIMMICHFSAIRLVEVSYMISVKRTSMVFGVIFGWIFFNEKNVGDRLLGSVVMVSGVILIAL